MEIQQLEKLVLMHLSECAPDSMDVRIILAKYNIEMSAEEFSKFIGHNLIGRGYAEFDFAKELHLKATELGIQLGKEVMNEIKNSGQSDNAKILPSIKPHSFPELTNVMHEPLLDYKYDGMPYIVYGKDTEIAHVPFLNNAEVSKEEAKRESLQNIKNCDVTIDEFDTGEFKIILCTGGYYAAEKILDVDFMNGIQQKLGAEMLVVSLPRKGCMYIANAILPPDQINKFSMFTQLKYNEDENTQPISTILFTVKDGVIAGLIDLVKEKVTEEAKQTDTKQTDTKQNSQPKGKNPGFFRKLFGLN